MNWFGFWVHFFVSLAFNLIDWMALINNPWYPFYREISYNEFNSSAHALQANIQSFIMRVYLEYIDWPVSKQNIGYVHCAVCHCGQCCWVRFSMFVREAPTKKIEQNEKAIELTFEVLMKLLFRKHKKCHSLRGYVINGNEHNKKSLRVKDTHRMMLPPWEINIFFILLCGSRP